MTTIAVTAPTGHVGSRVAQLLVAAGTRPVLLARDSTRLDPGVRAAAEVRTIDLRDTASVVAATAGIDAAFWLDGVGESSPDPVAASTALGATIAEAVRRNGIGRNVFASSGGAELRRGAGSIDGLAAIEVALDAAAADTGAHVTHLRSGFYFTNLLMDLDGLRAGRITATRRPDEALAWVDPRDIGEVAAARLLSTAWTGRHVQGVHGPRDLSYAEVAEILTVATGRPIAYAQLSDDEVRAQLREAGLPDAVVEGIVGMTVGTRDTAPEPPRSAVTTTPSTLEGWAYEVLRPLLA